MPDVTLPGRMAVLGRVLVETWSDHGHDWDVTYSTVALAELLNALLAGRRDVAAGLLAEIEKVAGAMTGQRIADLEQWIADLEHQAVELAAEVAKLTRAIRRALEVLAAINHTTEREGAGE